MAKLYFYYSAMNAGKSTTLLQSSYNYRERGMETLLFKPAIDDRHNVNTIHSRIGLEDQAICFDEGFNLYDYVVKHNRATDCILIDEAQFLTKSQVGQLTDITDGLNIPVLTYGIRSDFRGEPFTGSLYLLCWADELTEIKTICHCGRKAIMNLRVDDHNRPVRKGKQIEIGGNERYIATCRKHFKNNITDP
jgi:thymidine kinase